LLFSLFLIGCNNSSSPTEIKGINLYTEEQEKIIDKYVYNCADKLNYYSSEYQDCLNKGLMIDSTVAYLWQQKAMPYFKQMKYEVGMIYLDKAVEYKTEQYLPYRAFIKCIFAKTYELSIRDFEECIKRYGNSYVMDHSYQFYIALSYLQLNNFARAEKIFHKDIQDQAIKWGEDEIHHLDLFYYGISKFEQKKFQEAIIEFDKALKIYPQFSDVLYYKALCLKNLNRKIEAAEIFSASEKYYKAGFTINEDNVVYETYPYQKKWK